jgi:hypothetical protein
MIVLSDIKTTGTLVTYHEISRGNTRIGNKLLGRLLGGNRYSCKQVLLLVFPGSDWQQC